MNHICYKQLKNNTLTPKLSIGMPVYNGEEFIRKRLDNILSQTFSDFELIISDDSTDSTPQICKEYAKKDSRIRYIHQEKKRGWIWNFNFLLQEAIGDYFVWAPIDDKWDESFIEKNIDVLDSDEKIVGSISRLKRYGHTYDLFLDEPGDSFITKNYKKFRRFFRPFGAYPISGTYEQKARKYMKNRSPLGLYSIFRTDKLQKSIIHQPIGAWDFVIMLNILKYGDLHVVDEDLLYYYMEGISSKGIIDTYKKHNLSFKELLFPSSSLVLWCAKNLGIKFFLRNLDHFILLYFYGLTAIIFELIKIRTESKS